MSGTTPGRSKKNMQKKLKKYRFYSFGKIGKTLESVNFKKTQRSKVRVFEGAVYRIIAVFGRKSSSERKKKELMKINIGKVQMCKLF